MYIKSFSKLSSTIKSLKKSILHSFNGSFSSFFKTAALGIRQTPSDAREIHPAEAKEQEKNNYRY